MASGDIAASPTRDQDNQNNRASGDTEEGGFTPEWVETHGINSKALIKFSIEGQLIIINEINLSFTNMYYTII